MLEWTPTLKITKSKAVNGQIPGQLVTDPNNPEADNVT